MSNKKSKGQETSDSCYANKNFIKQDLNFELTFNWLSEKCYDFDLGGKKSPLEPELIIF